jgi:biopolymer transport protein ExbD
MRNRRRRGRGRSLEVPKVSLTPLIDTALTLLIIFMITAPMMTNIIKVELPSSRADESVGHEQQEFVVSVDKDKNVYFNAQKMSMETLIKKLKVEIGKQENTVVFVQADQGVSYGQVIDVVDTLKTVGGIKYVALATKQAI